MILNVNKSLESIPKNSYQLNFQHKANFYHGKVTFKTYTKSMSELRLLLSFMKAKAHPIKKNVIKKISNVKPQLLKRLNAILQFSYISSNQQKLLKLIMKVFAISKRVR